MATQHDDATLEQEVQQQESAWSGAKAPFKASYGKLMMWYFLLSDAFTFAGFLIAYGSLRFSSPSWPVPDVVFNTAPFDIHHLFPGGKAPLIFVTFMSFLLIVSSVTMVRAVQEGHRENKRGVVFWMLLTVIGGLGFLGCQAWEWSNLIGAEHMTITVNPFGTYTESGVLLDDDGNPTGETIEAGQTYLMHKAVLAGGGKPADPTDEPPAESDPAPGVGQLPGSDNYDGQANGLPTEGDDGEYAAASTPEESQTDDITGNVQASDAADNATDDPNVEPFASAESVEDRDASTGSGEHNDGEHADDDHIQENRAGVEQAPMHADEDDHAAGEHGAGHHEVVVTAYDSDHPGYYVDEAGFIHKKYLVEEGRDAGEIKMQAFGPKAFGALFFFITGFHGFHVLSGVVFLLIIMINAAGGVYAARKNGYEMVEKIGLYWHFVDLVWVFVFLVFYLL